MKFSNYTEPRLCKGKRPTQVSNKSTLEKEWAKNEWYINYSFNGKQYRPRFDINRIQDHKEKFEYAQACILNLKNALKDGFNPEKPKEYISKKNNECITLPDAVEKYLQELKIYARPKTVGSYQSKLRYLIEAFPDKEVKSFTSKDLEKYIQNKIHSDKPAKLFLNNRSIELKKSIPWTPKTVKSARGVFSAFFQWCIASELFVGENPVSKIEAKKIRSEIAVEKRNIPFSEEDRLKIMAYLDQNDKTIAFYCRMIHYTCLRPGEIAALRVRDLDLNKGKITIPLAVTKNTKKSSVDIINIDSKLLNIIKTLFKEEYPKDYFLTSTSDSIIGAKSIGSNNAYKRFVKVLKALGLDKKGYTLYSFKYYSNVRRHLLGWKTSDVMAANRHSSLFMTEKYLKNINLYNNISEKDVPAI